MSRILKGAEVSEAIIKKCLADSQMLRSKGIIPTLAILRVGERADDISYERGAMKKCASAGVEVKNVVLPVDISSDDFFNELERLNNDEKVHGILMFRPLPAHIDGEKARCMLNFEKDVDGCTDASLAGVFTNSNIGFTPCTAQAAMEILDFYSIECQGKRAAVLGRSLVVGRPAAMLLMHKNATPVICHTKTQNPQEISRDADIIIVCTGQSESIGANYFKAGQVVVDVGIGWSEEKSKLVGDVDFENVCDIVEAVTPVPGGVGAVTTAVLVSHVVEAALKKL